MKITVVGMGYVGLVTATCFAESGNEVVGVEVDADRVRLLNEGRSPLYEPGLEELLRRNLKQGRLSFTTDLARGVRASEILFLAVGTPPRRDGSPDLKQLDRAVRALAPSIHGPKVIVTKSTVPVGTCERIAAILKRKTRHPVETASNPEFLKEGAAVEDFMKPDRVVVGTTSPRVEERMRELYAPFVRTGNPILFMDPRSAELTKYAANAMLATKVSFINEIANLCEALGADVDQIRRGIGYDRRIGFQFLFPGVGFGGSCFPKDLQAILHEGKRRGVPLKLLEGVGAVNRAQQRILVGRIEAHWKGRIRGKTFAVWGLAFKPKTDDVREASSIVIIRELLRRGARVRAHDPEAIPTARRLLGEEVTYCPTPYEALVGADALVLVTEWNEFRRPDFRRIRKLLKSPVVFDGRNLFDPREMRQRGFRYYSIGRPSVPPGA